MLTSSLLALFRTACARLEASIGLQTASCDVAFGAPNSFAHLTSSCRPNGCVLRLVQTLKELMACQVAGYHTNGTQSLIGAPEAVETIATLQYLCTKKTPSSYCAADTATWRSINGLPTCAEFVNSGCCLSNFLAILDAIDPAQLLQVSEAIRIQCNLDVSSLTPCQPPGWANVTFAGQYYMRLPHALARHLTQPTCAFTGFTRTPAITEIKLTDSTVALRISFDASTDRAGVPLNGSCSNILDTATSAALGSRSPPLCAWDNATTLRVTLGGAPTIALGG